MHVANGLKDHGAEKASAGLNEKKGKSLRPAQGRTPEGIQKAGGLRTPAELVSRESLILRVFAKRHRADEFYSEKVWGQEEKVRKRK